jgi:large conductance mechanosensitive channel
MGGFRKLLLRGNLVDLAVAVVVGLAFNTVVQALIKDLITPLITAFGARHNFSGLGFSVHGSTVAYGDFINAALSFVIIATVVYYFVVAPTNRLAVIATRNTDAAQRPCPGMPQRHPGRGQALQVLHRDGGAGHERPGRAGPTRRCPPAAGRRPPRAVYLASA